MNGAVATADTAREQCAARAVKSMDFALQKLERLSVQQLGFELSADRARQNQHIALADGNIMKAPKEPSSQVASANLDGNMQNALAQYRGGAGNSERC